MPVTTVISQTTAPIGQVSIREVLGRATQGVTEPFLCRDTRGDLYYVKGRSAGRRSQIAEWVSARLASRFGLPIAPYALVEVPAELVTAATGKGLQLGSGIAFGSRAVLPSQELNATTRKRVSPALATDVLIFDWWIHNEDRYLTDFGGNPNLLWDEQADSLVVIDHNQAFDPGFNKQEFLRSHAFAQHWNRVFSDCFERERYRSKFQDTLVGLDEIHQSIPETWWFADDGIAADISWDEVVQCLNRYDQDDYWNPL